MINATNRIPSESTCMEVSDSVFYGVLAAFIIVLILGVVFLFCGFLSKRNSPKDYDGVDTGYGGVWLLHEVFKRGLDFVYMKMIKKWHAKLLTFSLASHCTQIQGFIRIMGFYFCEWNETNQMHASWHFDECMDKHQNSEQVHWFVAFLEEKVNVQNETNPMHVCWHFNESIGQTSIFRASALICCISQVKNKFAQ